MRFPTQRLFIIAIPLIIVLSAAAYVRSRVSSPEQGRLAVQENMRATLPDNSAWQQTLSTLGTTTSGGAGLSGLESFFSGESLLTGASNTTQALGISILSDYSSAKRLGTIDSGTIDYIASKSASEITSLSFLPEPTETSDITIGGPQASLDSYGRSVSSLRDEYFGRFRAEMLSSSASSPDDPRFLDLLSTAEGYYRIMATQLISTPVPAELAQIHLLLINNYRESAEALVALRELDSDPVKGIAGFSTYQRLQEAELSILSVIQTELAKSGILFNVTTVSPLP
jgi:hypothetical protein